MTVPASVGPDPSAWQAIAFSIQLCLVAVFLASALPKLRDPKRFVATVRTYELLPTNLVRLGAWGVIAGEIAVAVLALGGWSPLAIVGTSIILIVGFTIAVSVNLRRGREIDCGCFGGADETISSRTLVRLSVLAGGVSIYAILTLGGPAEGLSPFWWLSNGASFEYTLEALMIGTGLTLLAVWCMEIPNRRRVVAFDQTSSQPAELKP